MKNQACHCFDFLFNCKLLSLSCSSLICCCCWLSGSLGQLVCVCIFRVHFLNAPCAIGVSHPKITHRKFKQVVGGRIIFERQWVINLLFLLSLCLFFPIVACLRLSKHPQREPGISDVSPLSVWNLRAVSLIPLFYICSLVLLPSPVALSVLSFSAFCPFF